MESGTIKTAEEKAKQKRVREEGMPVNCLQRLILPSACNQTLGFVRFFVLKVVNQATGDRPHYLLEQ